jgi:hypothetical protein
MNLRGLVRGAINAINRDKQLTWLASQGAITDDTGLSLPSYAAPRTVWGQIQPLPTDRLSHMEQLNIQGVLRAVYLRGAVASAVRVDGTGGDLLLFPENFNTSLAQVTDWTADSALTADSSMTVDGSTYDIGTVSRTWLVVLVDEQWDDWCRVTVKLQNDQAIAWTADSSVSADSYNVASG